MGQEFENVLTSMQQEVESIEMNRREKNQRYLNCINEYMDHLNTEIQQFQTGQQANAKCKEQISLAFRISHGRILQAKIRRTYHEKHKFWRASKVYAELFGSGKLKMWCQENKNTARQRYHATLMHSNEQKPTYEQLFVQKPNSGHELRQHQNMNRVFEGQYLQGNTSINKSQAKMKISKQSQLSGNELFSQGYLETNFLDNFMIDRH